MVEGKKPKMQGPYRENSRVFACCEDNGAIVQEPEGVWLHLRQEHREGLLLGGPG